YRRRAAGSPPDPGSRRYRGTPQRAEESGQRWRSGGHAFHQHAWPPLLWREVGLAEAPGAGALESASVGVAVADRPVPAGGPARAAPAQDQRGWGATAEAARAALAARASAGVGRRWRFCGRGAGAGRCQAPGDHGLASALGCRPVSSARAPAPRHAWPQTLARETPAPPAGLGGARGYALADRGSGLVRGPAPTAVGVLPH